jgi:hypothetical protein
VIYEIGWEIFNLSFLRVFNPKNTPANCNGSRKKANKIFAKKFMNIEIISKYLYINQKIKQK